MSIAFYVPELNNSELNTKIYECLNNAIEQNTTNDASLFVNNVSYMNQKIKFGVFNSTELWNYTGLLITTTVGVAYLVQNIVNKFKHVFYAGVKEPNIMAFIDTINKVPSFVMNEEEQKEVKRLTGKTLPILKLDVTDISKEFLK